MESGVAVRRTVGAFGLMLTVYDAQPEGSPSESSASTWKVCVLAEFQECETDDAVPLGTYPSAGAHSSIVSSSSQSMPYRSVGDWGWGYENVYVYFVWGRPRVGRGMVGVVGGELSEQVMVTRPAA